MLRLVTMLASVSAASGLRVSGVRMVASAPATRVKTERYSEL